MSNIQQISQVFSNDIAETLRNCFSTVPWKYGWSSNKATGFGHWNYDFTKTGSMNSIDVSNKLPKPISIAWDYVQKNHLGPQTLLRSYVNGHTHGIEGYSHTDSIRSHDRTMVIYMNPIWRRDWGGETVVYNNDDTINHSELPKFNCALIFPSDQLHCARSLTRFCPALRLTFMFKFSPIGVDPYRDVIQTFLISIGADKISHSKSNLMKHLLRVYDILKSNGYDQDTSSAGAMHSIFGTNKFKNVVLTSNQRDLVVRTIGETSTKLVDLFKTINRPNSLETALREKHTRVTLNFEPGTLVAEEITLDLETFNSLCAIEAANLAEQSSLTKFQEISKFLKSTHNLQRYRPWSPEEFISVKETL